MAETISNIATGILLSSLLFATIVILLWLRRERKWQSFREEWEAELDSYLDGDR